MFQYFWRFFFPLLGRLLLHQLVPISTKNRKIRTRRYRSRFMYAYYIRLRLAQKRTTLVFRNERRNERRQSWFVRSHAEFEKSKSQIENFTRYWWDFFSTRRSNFSSSLVFILVWPILQADGHSVRKNSKTCHRRDTLVRHLSTALYRSCDSVISTVWISIGNIRRVTTTRKISCYFSKVQLVVISGVGQVFFMRMHIFFGLDDRWSYTFANRVLMSSRIPILNWINAWNCTDCRFCRFSKYCPEKKLISYFLMRPFHFLLEDCSGRDYSAICHSWMRYFH